MNQNVRNEVETELAARATALTAATEALLREWQEWPSEAIEQARELHAQAVRLSVDIHDSASDITDDQSCAVLRWQSSRALGQALEVREQALKSEGASAEELAWIIDARDSAYNAARRYLLQSEGS